MLNKWKPHSNYVAKGNTDIVLLLFVVPFPIYVAIHDIKLFRNLILHLVINRILHGIFMWPLSFMSIAPKLFYFWINLIINFKTLVLVVHLFGHPYVRILCSQTLTVPNMSIYHGIHFKLLIICKLPECIYCSHY